MWVFMLLSRIHVQDCLARFPSVLGHKFIGRTKPYSCKAPTTFSQANANTNIKAYDENENRNDNYQREHVQNLHWHLPIKSDFARLLFSSACAQRVMAKSRDACRVLRHLRLRAMKSKIRRDSDGAVDPARPERRGPRSGSVETDRRPARAVAKAGEFDIYK